MKLKLTKPAGPFYFTRVSPDGPEDGPLTLEKLRELAAGGGLTPETLIRRDDENDLHKLADDGALMAELWPADPSGPAANSGFPAAPDEQPAGEPEFDVRETLRENVDRDHAARDSRPPEPPPRDPAAATRNTLTVIRWTLGIACLAFGIGFWVLADKKDSFNFGNYLLIGLVPLITGVFLLIGELLKVLLSPFGVLVDYVFQGGGGGVTADYWTADSLMDQGEYRKALDEYRKILWRHPRELKAHLEAVRAARAMDDEEEVGKIRKLALKNLRSAQDRDMFLATMERMRNE